MSQNTPDDRQAVPINWIVPDHVSASYANHIVVRHSDNEFIIHFFEERPPIIVGSDDTAIQKRSSITSIDAVCVARVTVSAPRMQSFIAALSQNLQNYEQKIDRLVHESNSDA